MESGPKTRSLCREVNNDEGHSGSQFYSKGITAPVMGVYCAVF